MTTTHPDGGGLRESESTYRNLLKTLTVKEQKLVHEYLIDGNASRAAKVAGYSPRSAPEIACQTPEKLRLRLRSKRGLICLPCAVRSVRNEWCASLPPSPLFPRILLPNQKMDC